jgi:hypothetical protein
VAVSREVDVDPSAGTSSKEEREGAARISAEDARKLVERLRSTPAEEVIADVFSTLLTAAEVKLGRRDARLFIDLCAATFEYAGRFVSEELAKQVENALGQLRFAQVSAESQTAKQGGDEPNDLTRTPTPPATGARAEAPTGGSSPQASSSRLWVPGH